MEFHTNPPPSLPPDYHCLAKAIITLYPATSDNSELAHTTPRGSNGHRLSFGFGSKHDEDGDPINQPAKPKIGGGWGNFVRRLSMDMNKDKDVADVREGAEGQGQQQTGSSQDPAKFKTGKWSTNVEVAVTHTHLLVIFSPEHPLATYPPPPGAPGYIHYSSDGHTCEHHPHPTSSEDKHTSIGRKIIDVFKPGGITKEEAVKEHIIDPTTGQPTECPPTEPSETHPEPIPFPAPTPEMVEKTFPAFVGGKATMYVAIPLGAIRVAEMKLVDDKRETGVRVPINSHFSSSTHPTDTLGQEHDESYSRSGKIKFLFDRNWLGAKAEAEVLQHAIRQAVENRSLSPGGGDAAQAALDGAVIAA